MEPKIKTVRPDITINNNLATYSFRFEGQVLGTYTGQFVFKCFLLPAERLAASRDRRELLGEFGVLAHDVDKNLALALTELKYRIVTAPPFWNTNQSMGGNIPDIDLIFNVFDAAMDAQQMFKETKELEKEKLLAAASKAAEVILAQKQEEKGNEKKTEEQEIEDELTEMDNASED